MASEETLKTMGSVSIPRLVVASFLALLAASAAWTTLPSSTFRAVAIVGIDEPSPAFRLAAARGAASLAVSNPVMIRTAVSLKGTEVVAPAPQLAEKVGVATGVAVARSAPARLAETIAPAVTARPGDGLVEIEAAFADPSRAALVATSVAEALVTEEDGAALAAVRRNQAVAASKLEMLRATARSARERLKALGASDGEPVDSLSAAVAATRTAETRLAAIRNIMAAGKPPLGGGAELPPSAATLQQTWWDLKKQLDKAVETLGDRHTTVIALRDGLARAATSLTAEWSRIQRGAENDLSAARSREAVLRKANAGIDPATSAAIDEARGVARLADAAVARAASAVTSSATVSSSSFRLVAPAALPSTATGLPAWQRVLISASAGLSTLGLALVLSGRRRRSMVEATEAVASERNEPVAPLVVIPIEAPLTETSLALEEIAEPAIETAVLSRREGDFAFEPPHTAASFEERTDMPFEAVSYAPPSEDQRGAPQDVAPRLDSTLRDALRGIAADLAELAPSHGIPTIMVAAQSAGADTGSVALALGEAAAELGYRVLVIESEHGTGTLAAAAEPRAEPFLIDTFGALRVALPAERPDTLYLAPALRDGARIASALARNTQAELIDDLASSFDAVVIDGGRAIDAAAAGWRADAFIRVGRFASRRDDEQFLAPFDAPAEALFGTVAAGRFVAREIVEPEPRVVQKPVLRAVAGTRDEGIGRRVATTTPLRAVPRRRAVGR